MNAGLAVAVPAAKAAGTADSAIPTFPRAMLKKVR